MQEPLVSIKMLTYNHGPHISQAIEGILLQKTNFPFELVIGEDCSTDGTRQIVFDFQKKYPQIIRVITSDNNVGMKKNASRISQECRGKYVAYCEGDDHWHNLGKLQKQVDYLEKHPECGLTCSDFDCYYVKTGSIKHCILKLNGKEFQSPNIVDIVNHLVEIRTCTVLARRDLVDQIKAADPYIHQSDYFKMGDTQLWAEISLISEIHFINESLATYQILEESATQSKDKKKVLRFWISSHEMVLYLCKKHNLPDYIRNKYEKYWRRKTLQLAFVEKRLDLALTVTKEYGPLSFRESIWYLGTKYRILRTLPHLLNLTINSKRYLFKKNK